MDLVRSKFHGYFLKVLTGACLRYMAYIMDTNEEERSKVCSYSLSESSV